MSAKHPKSYLYSSFGTIATTPLEKFTGEDFTRFKTVFGFPLNKCLERLGPLIHFDIIKFDELLKVPDGTSTKDHIEKTFGPDAVKFAESLLNKYS